MVGGPGRRPAGHTTPRGQLVGGEAARPEEELSLSTMCACGHVRKHHRGLRIEVTGACLKCGCEEFRRTSTPPDPRGEMMENIRAGLEQVARLQAIVADLRTRLGDDGLSG